MELSRWQLLCLAHPKEVFSWCCQEDVGIEQGDFWRRWEGAVTLGDSKIPSQLLVNACTFPSVLLWFFHLAFWDPLHSAHRLFQGHGLGRGKSNFSFLLQLSCKSLDFHIYFPGSLCAIILIRSLLPLLCYSTHTLNLKKKIKAVISYFHKWKDVSSIGRHWKKFCSLKILQLNY